MKIMTITRKLILGSLLLAALPVILVSIAGSRVAGDVGSDILEQQIRERMIAVRETQKLAIENYFKRIRNQVQTFSEDRMIVDAMRQFRVAYPQYREQTAAGDTEVADMRNQLSEYYTKEFARVYQEKNPGHSIDAMQLLNRLDDDGVTLQHNYIVKNPNALGEKHRMDAAAAGTTYDAIHEIYHPVIRSYLEHFGYYDIFLVDPDNGRVMYTVFKELDFSTSLMNGAYADTGLGKVFKEAKASGKVAIDDFKSYVPSYEDPASFIAAPIKDGGETIGIVIFQMPISEINNLTTSYGDWEGVGLGHSGETYLVGPDKLMRSISRFLLQEPDNYLAAAVAAGLPAITAETIAKKNTTIGLQPVNTLGVDAALAGESGFAIFPDYRSVPVLSAYAPLDIEGLNWVILSEIDETESHGPQQTLVKEISTTSAILAVIMIAFSALLGGWYARSFSKPIVHLQQVINDIEHDADLTRHIQIHSHDEIGTMAASLNAMFKNFRGTVSRIAAASNSINHAAQQVAAITTQTTDGIRHQQLETDQVATAMEEMSATVREVSGNATGAADAATRAQQGAQAGDKVMKETVETIHALASGIEQAARVIQELEAHSNGIGSVLDVIGSIAEQTNLLALNAAIEAARAGEQGRGFAVVADEVRTLASRTQQSTREIQQMIEHLQSGSRNAVSAMNRSQEQAKASVSRAGKASEALNTITHAISEITEMNGHIAVAANEQTSVAEEVTRSVQAISAVADKTTAGAEETASTSQRLTDLASELQTAVNRFKV